MSEATSSSNMIELVRQHHALLYRYAYRLCGSPADAEDLVQETFLQACRKWDQLREVDRAKNWLCTILRNRYLQRLRTGGPAIICSENLETLPDPHEGETAMFGVDSEQLQTALASLPEQFRAPLILFYFEEFSYQEIAEQLDVPLGTVMSRLSRGKSHLRQRLFCEPVTETDRAADTRHIKI